ncbi:hypothetical protein ACJVDH_13825 [Pedobacter sp. AW1-32]|uniref:hypothetical protein n=1 Tax=Pedobacter sp. AW1-32 TaxID=3383026 RepID=UPI003FEEA86D
MLKNGDNEKAFKTAKEFIKTGKGSDPTKSKLKTLFIGLKKTGDFEGYYAGLLKVAHENDKAVWAKRMINDAAPDFPFFNLNGETVQLSALNVKLSFWNIGHPGAGLGLHHFLEFTWL